jgi:DNA-binding transcriptional MerR regulator
MARLEEHERALSLRKQGMSYSQIKKILKLSKSTLSVWLKDYPLPKQRIRELRDWNEQRIERYRETMKRKKERRLEEIYKTQKKDIRLLNKRESFIAGLMLYWGEGTKSRRNSLGISNSDPAVIKFFIYWATNILAIPKNKIKVQLHLYKDMNIGEETKYWSNSLRIPRKQFNLPYIKKTFSKRINHKGSFGHGTCQVRAGNTLIAEKVFMSIKVISNLYS